MDSRPWRGFRADPRVADYAFAAFFALGAGAVLFRGTPGEIPQAPLVPRWTLAVGLWAAGTLLASSRLRGQVLGPLRRRFPRAGRHVRSWYPVFLVPLLYPLVPLLHRTVHGGRTFDHRVMAWEEALFGGQPARAWAEGAPWLPLSELLHASYLAYYALVALPPVLLHMRGQTRAFEAAVGTFALVSVIHFTVFVFFPVLGPRYLFGPPAQEALGSGPLYRFTHELLEWGSSPGAAFPSAHVGVAVSQAIIAARWLPRWAPWITLVTVLLSISTVYGGFHYLVDAVVGAAVGGTVAAAVVHRAGTPAGASSAPSAPAGSTGPAV
jgi:membrane-associated phospholipid phosphatase